MSPLALALLLVVAVFAVFLASRPLPSGRKWAVRVAVTVGLYISAGALSDSTRAAARAAELSVYFAIPAILLYLFVSGRADSRRSQHR